MFFLPAYTGNIGLVVNHKAEIQIVAQDRSGVRFKGSYDLVPGIPVPITGEIKKGMFKVDGWFSTPVKFDWGKISGDGVFLWRR